MPHGHLIKPNRIPPELGIDNTPIPPNAEVQLVYIPPDGAMGYLQVYNRTSTSSTIEAATDMRDLDNLRFGAWDPGSLGGDPFTMRLQKVSEAEEEFRVAKRLN